MKQSVSFIVCMLTSVAMYAAEEETNQRLPFVREGKQWHVVQSDYNGNTHHERYTLTGKEVKWGKTYMQMQRVEDNKTVTYNEALLREDGYKVYVFDSERQKEFLMFDFTLKPGDTYTTYSYEENRDVTYKVLAVDDYTEGPKVSYQQYDEEADSMITKHRYLQKWTVCSLFDPGLQMTWIESSGSLEGPLANLYESRPVSTSNRLAYVIYDPELIYLPFTLHDEFAYVHGCNLPTDEEDYSDEWHHKLTYELEGGRLHVYGKVFAQCGPNNYALFLERKTDDPTVRKIEFVIQEVPPVANCRSLYATDFHVPGFDPNISYTVVDSYGEEHPVVNQTPLTPYRPFIEDGKVWKVGFTATGNPVQMVSLYYFDGETTIDGKTCKQMLRQRYFSPDYARYNSMAHEQQVNYEGAWYEEDKKVYTYDTTDKRFKLVYDFSTGSNDTLLLGRDMPFVIGPKLTGGLKGFKGVYRPVRCLIGENSIYSPTWLEGVGSIDGPTVNMYSGYVDPVMFLMSCSAGDEVIYLNDEYEDGATPKIIEARKNRIDFTHTIKIRPKTRLTKVSEGETDDTEAPDMKYIYGEYNGQQLGINLNALDNAYQVIISDNTGKNIYEKAVNAGNIVGLNIDISKYTPGDYTIAVENDYESFRGEFEVEPTGIVDVKSKRETNEREIYNLQGQRMSTLLKGLNIINGQKIIVKQ